MSVAGRLRPIGCIALALALGGCLSGKRISDIDAPSSAAPSSGLAWRVPDGVVVGEGERGSLEIDGLYPSTVANDPRCCWIAPSAMVEAVEPPSASVLAVTVLVPEYPFFDERAQVLSVSFAGVTTRATGLTPGVHRLEIALAPGARKTGPVTIGLRTDRTFVPANEHVNGDTRALGIILLGIGFR